MSAGTARAMQTLPYMCSVRANANWEGDMDQGNAFEEVVHMFKIKRQVTA